MLFATEAELVEELLELVSKRFLYGQVDDSALIPNPKDDSWIHNLPGGEHSGRS